MFEQTLTPRQRRYYDAVAVEARATLRDDAPATTLEDAIDTAFMFVDPADYLPRELLASVDDERSDAEYRYVRSLMRR